jgi:orotate phosphoribosyltransferase
VLIVDDVISAGTSVRESVELIRGAGARPAGVVIALDRMERGQGALSATQEVQQTFQIPVISIATLSDLLAYLAGQGQMARELQAVARYRREYGVG